jgi:hypothetical protein
MRSCRPHAHRYFGQANIIFRLEIYINTIVITIVSSQCKDQNSWSAPITIYTYVEVILKEQRMHSYCQLQA